MKTDVSSTVVYSDGFQSESFFTIKQDNLAHVFGILRNQLYSNKPLAVIREYCTNAFDAHVDAGIADEPIIVTVPTHISPVLSIRDKGLGLSTEQVYDIFASYGESTKRNTNSQVGMLGLGSKSAFCYTDSFTVVSYHNGVKSVYNAFIDTTQIGKISLIHSEPTNETGLEIKVNVSPYDISLFNTAIVDFLKYFNPKPIILNNDALNRQIIDFDINFATVLSGDNWKVVHKSRYSVSDIVNITMGNVIYPVNISSLPSQNLRHFLEGFRHYFLYVDVPIGTVKPSASRESLDMNTKTSQVLVDTLNKVKDEIQAEYSKKIQSAKSMWDALLTYDNLHNKLGFSGLEANYNGVKITSNVIINRHGRIKSYVKPSQGTAKAQWKKDIAIPPHKSTIIFYHDTTIPMNSVYNRVVQYLDSIGDELRNHLHIISFTSTELMETWLSDIRFDGANKVNLANVAYINPKKSNPYKSVKSSAFIYTGHGYRNYAKWTETTIDINGSGVYLPVKRNICEGISFDALDRLREDMKSLNYNPQIIGVKYDEVANLGSGWVNYFDYCKQKCQEYIDINELQDGINKYFAYCNIHRNWYALKRRNIAFRSDDINTFLNNLKTTTYSVERMLSIQRNMNVTMLNCTDNKYLDEYNAINEKYFLIPDLDMSWVVDDTLIKYINMVN